MNNIRPTSYPVRDWQRYPVSMAIGTDKAESPVPITSGNGKIIVIFSLSKPHDMNAYYKIFADLPETDYESAVSWLERELELSLTKAYEEKYEEADVRHFNDNARRMYTLFFDCTQDWSDDIYGRAARVVFVFGRSAAGNSERNHKRMRQFCGSFKNQPEYVGYDKGHFIAHSNDGQIDQNLYPQLKELNRGLSQQGKLYRSMERYLQKNPGLFYFVRPVYSDLTWIADKIDFGIFTKERGLILNRFDNRKIQAPFSQ